MRTKLLDRRVHDGFFLKALIGLGRLFARSSNRKLSIAGKFLLAGVIGGIPLLALFRRAEKAIGFANEGIREEVRSMRRNGNQAIKQTATQSLQNEAQDIQRQVQRVRQAARQDPNIGRAVQQTPEARAAFELLHNIFNGLSEINRYHLSGEREQFDREVERRREERRRQREAEFGHGGNATSGPTVPRAGSGFSEAGRYGGLDLDPSGRSNRPSGGFEEAGRYRGLDLDSYPIYDMALYRDFGVSGHYVRKKSKDSASYMKRKKKLITHDSMPWTRENKYRRHEDIPGFLKKIGSGIKTWAKLRWIGISIENAAKTLNEAVRKSDKLLVKRQLGVLRGEFKKLEATYREVDRS